MWRQCTYKDQPTSDAALLTKAANKPPFHKVQASVQASACSEFYMGPGQHLLLRTSKYILSKCLLQVKYWSIGFLH